MIADAAKKIALGIHRCDKSFESKQKRMIRFKQLSHVYNYLGRKHDSLVTKFASVLFAKSQQLEES